MNYWGHIYDEHFFEVEAGKNKFIIPNDGRSETEHEALAKANADWNKMSDDVRRLLVVVNCSKNEKLDQCPVAYFEFADSDSCQRFVDDEKKFIWSNIHKIDWQGDVQLMESDEQKQK